MNELGVWHTPAAMHLSIAEPLSIDQPPGIRAAPP